MARGLKHMTDESDRARFFQLEEEKAKGGLCAVFSYQVSDYREDRARLISHVHSKRVRDSGHNLEQGKFQLHIRKSFFAVRIFRHGNWAPERLLNRPASSRSELDWTGPEQRDLTWKSFFEFEPNDLRRSLPA